MVVQFIAALALLSGVVYLTRKHAYTEGYTNGHAAGRSESAQLAYHRGHEDGLYEGRLKERLEQETREYKQQRDYEQGFCDALEAVRDEAYSAMSSEATIRLSA